MAGYSKLFSEIITSSIWSEDDKTRIVWITMLALKDMSGFVPAAFPGLANAARVTIEECVAAVAKLEAPDKYSRSTEDEGRRIKPVEGGWIILNHWKYRIKGNEDERREYKRKWIADYRCRQNVDTCRQHVDKRDTLQITDTDTEKNKSKSDSVIVPDKLYVSSPLANVSLLAPQTQTQTQTQIEKIAQSVKPPKPAPRIKLADEAWIESLKPDCRKQGINLDSEIIKAKRWLALNPSRMFTRRFFINWLNRADRNLITNDNRAPELEQRITQTQKALEEARR